MYHLKLYCFIKHEQVYHKATFKKNNSSRIWKSHYINET